jgi:hypothetical protein
MTHKADWKLPPFENTPEWWEEHDRWRKAYNTCATCGSTKLHLKNWDEVWRDGDLYCNNGHFVRYYDTG